MSEPGGISTGDLGWISTAVIIVGAAIKKWVLPLADWGEKRREAREARLAADEAALDEGWSAYRRRLEKRLDAFELRDRKREREHIAMRGALDLVMGALRTIDPLNPALRQADALLAKTFAVHAADYELDELTARAGEAIDGRPPRYAKEGGHVS